MNLIAFGLATGIALSFGGGDGPAPRDITTNKPSPEQCAAAAREGRNLLGCANPGAMVPASSNTGPPRPPQPPADRPRDPR